MKKIWVILAIVFLAAPFLGCQQEAQLKLASMLNFSPVEITGEVGQKVYTDYTKFRIVRGAITGPVKGTAYCINIEIENKLFSALTFKTIDVKIIPEGGEPLYMTRGHEDANKVFEIKPREKENFEFSTDLFTDPLIADSEGKPLMFEIMLKDGGNIVAGPFVTQLPNELKNLPSCDKNEKLTPLTFSLKKK